MHICVGALCMHKSTSLAISFDLCIEEMSFLPNWFKPVVLNLPNAAILYFTVPNVVTPNQKLFSLLLHNFNFATVMNNNINACGL